jgi:hypothetical protein
MATGDKEIQSTLNAIDEGVITFQEAVVKIQQRIYNKLLMFQKELIITNGTIVNSAKNIRLLSSLKKDLENIIFDDTDFLEAVKDFAKVYEVVTELNNQYFKALEKTFSPPKIIEAVKQQSVSLVIEGLSDSGLDANFINPVREIINNYVTTGGSYTQLSKELDNYINGYSSEAGPVDGQMTRYTKQITTDAINQYTATINDLTSSDLGWDWFKYVGSNIKTSRTFCIALTEKKYYHRSELAQIIKGNFTEFRQMKGEIYDKTKLPQGMYDDTNTSNFQVYRGGYNCGHQAYPIPNSSVPKNLLKMFA